MDKAEVEFSHHMAVICTHESPREARTPRRSGEQVLDLGEKVDRDLIAGDVRLTMGGEPTFVAGKDSRTPPEWNTAALGPTKRGYAMRWWQKLRAQYSGSGGFLHFGQGRVGIRSSDTAALGAIGVLAQG